MSHPWCSASADEQVRGINPERLREREQPLRAESSRAALDARHGSLVGADLFAELLERQAEGPALASNGAADSLGAAR